tara:strand:- start:303 stop:455 length:153 start_codon:yes stop_codon:yes gene_type:complete
MFNKEELILMFKALEAATIQGKHALTVVQVLQKLDKEIVKMTEEEQSNGK